MGSSLETNTSPFLLFLFISLSRHLWFLTSPLRPTCMNGDRDRHMQRGQQSCLASASSLWQKISMRTDNGTSNENNTVCQPRNSVCHSRPFPMLGVFHELRWTRKLSLKFNSLSLHQLQRRTKGKAGFSECIYNLWQTDLFDISHT